MIYFLEIEEINDISIQKLIDIDKNHWIKIVVSEKKTKVDPFSLIKTVKFLYNQLNKVNNSYYLANGVIKKSKTSFWFRTSVKEYINNNGISQPFFESFYDKINVNYLSGSLRLLLDIHIATNHQKNLILYSLGCPTNIENNIKDMIYKRSDYSPKVIEVTTSIRAGQKIGKERVELPHSYH